MGKKNQNGIGVNIFNKTIKDSVRDFFKYGYMRIKEMAQPGKEDTAVKKNYSLLVDLLKKEGVEKTRGGKAIILEKDSQSYEENPFHNLYRYCNVSDKDMKLFLKIVIALSDFLEIKGVSGKEPLLFDKELNEEWNKNIFSGPGFSNGRGYIENEGIRKLKSGYLVENGERIKIEQRCTTDEDFCRLLASARKGHNRNSNTDRKGILNEYRRVREIEKDNRTRWEYIQEYIGKSKESIEDKDKSTNKERKFLKEISKNSRVLDTVELYNFIEFGPTFKSGKDSNDYIKDIRDWIKRNKILEIIDDTRTGEHNTHNLKLSIITMDYLLKNSSSENIKEKFKEALLFFSRTELFGEIGAFLVKRIESSETDIENKNKKPLFYFKHDYFIHSINDYNLIDILYVIEKNEKQTNRIYICEIDYGETISESYKILGIPVEIRISEKDGKEYVVFYLPVERKYKFLKVDFINKIINYKYIKLSGEQEKQIQDDLKQVKENLKKCWGVMPGVGKYSGIVGDAAEENCEETVAITFRYKKEEYYIKPRIKKELRYGTFGWDDGIGEVTVRIPVLNKEELYAWIRSFYGRVVKVECNSNMIKKFYNETNTMYQSYSKKYLIKGDEKKAKASTPSKQLFHVVFGVYYEKMGNLVLQYAMDGNRLEKTEITDVFKDCQSDMTKMYEIYENVCDYIEHWRLKVKDNPSRVTYLYSILPLTNIEKRWICTVLEEPKMKLFLTQEEISEIKECLINEKEIDITNDLDDLNDAISFSETLRAYYEKREIQQFGLPKNVSQRLSSYENRMKEILCWLSKIGEDKLEKIVFGDRSLQRKWKRLSALEKKSLNESECRNKSGIKELYQNILKKDKILKELLKNNEKVEERINELDRVEKKPKEETIKEILEQILQNKYEMLDNLFNKIEPLHGFPLTAAVNYFDRYKLPEISEDEMQNQRTHFQTILRAIHEKKRILALYRTSYNKTIVSLVIPTRVEYSKRDDVFRFICMEEKAVNENRDATYTLNLERIVEVRIIENDEEFWIWRNGGKKIVITDYGKIYIKFQFKELVKEEQEYFHSRAYVMEEKQKLDEINDDDFNAAVESVSEQLKREKREVTITFPYDEEKTDQILTEFSPWKKVCKKDGNLYTLTIYYPDSELSDITIRLLSYGNYITIKEEKERIDIEEKKEKPKKTRKSDGENNKTQPLYQDTFWNISRDNRLEKEKKGNQNIQRRSIKSEFEKRLGNQLEIWKEREQQKERENELDERDR